MQDFNTYSIASFISIFLLNLMLLIWFRITCKKKNNTIQCIQVDLEREKDEKDAAFLERDEIKVNLDKEVKLRIAYEERLTHIPELKNELEKARQEAKHWQDNAQGLKNELTKFETLLEEEKKSSEEKLILINEAKKALSDSFKALSHDALKQNTESFLELAQVKFEKVNQTHQGDLKLRQKAIEELVKPLSESLKSFDGSIRELEKSRTKAYTSLSEQVKALVDTQHTLKAETSNLVQALRTPHVRGRWGEIQLKRVVEMAGMVEHCDFEEQKSYSDSEKRLRPDLVINLPNRKQLIVDSKTPLKAYLESYEAKNETQRESCLKTHAKHVKTHIQQLSSKSYWDQFSPAPEFVVLFLPGEPFFSAALQQDPTLIEYGVEQKVIIATPTTLIALLRAVAFGWRQKQLEDNAHKISKIGIELYDRLRILSEHFDHLRKGIESVIASYNKASASFETRVIPSARRLKELGAGTDLEVKNLASIEKQPDVVIQKK